MEDNKKVCSCQEERKDFCILYRIKDGEERPVVINARNVKEAEDIFKNAVRVSHSLINCVGIPTFDLSDIVILGFFERF